MQGQQSAVWEQSRAMAAHLYRAAIRPDPLTDWSRIFRDQDDSLFVDFTLMTPSGEALRIGTSDPQGTAHQDFVAHYQFINPLNRHWQVAPQGRIVHFDDRLIDETCRRSEFYSRYSEFLQSGDGVCMVLGQGRAQKVLMHMRLPRHRGGAERSVDLLGSLSEDLVASFEIYAAMLNAANTIQCVADSLDHEGLGLAIVGGDGRIEHVNGSMNALLREGRLVRAERGRMAAGTGHAVPGLPDLIRRTARAGEFGRIRYRDPGRASNGTILACPAPLAVDLDHAGSDRIVLLVSPGGRRDRESAESLRASHGLTATEARVARRLGDGRTTRQIADEFGVQINSIRMHLKAIYAKTGTHSQVELLNFLQDADAPPPHPTGDITRN
jgi:DNA-binding CsgD family transcriptional regulator